MRKIKIVPFIISVLFPLVCTAFVVCYSYGVNDIYTVNKQRYEAHVENEYYNENGNAVEEIEKGIKYDSDKYNQFETTVNATYFENEFKTVLYGLTSKTETTDEDGNVKTIDTVAYNLYIYDVNYKNNYKDVNTFKTTEGVYLENGATLAVVYVPGVGVDADIRLDDAIQEIIENGSTAKATIVNAEATSVRDNNSHNYVVDADDDTDFAPAYRVSLFNSQNSDFLVQDLNTIYGADAEVEEGFTCALINYYSPSTSTHALKQISQFSLNTLVSADSLNNDENAKTGYSQDVTKIGISYIKFIFPTLLWQGALTLVLTGVLGVLFYAIWEADPAETEEQRRIKQLQKNKKAVKKAK